jgi:NitT/TauT family transport system ATP-binding protein
VTSAAAAKPGGGGAAAPARPHVVEFRKVTKLYGRKVAVQDVSFVVEDISDRGEFVAMLGPSGCGKSTVLRMIAGLAPQFPPTSGEALVMGLPIEGPGADRGMVFQEYTAFDNRTVLDNVAFGLECQGVSRVERHEAAREWIGKVGLNVRTDADKYPHELSGGMRQRVAIARTLILKPRIILMDEPFGALDPMTRMRMQDLLVALWREVSATVFFVTHSIEEAVYLGDRVYVMSPGPGRLVEQVPAPLPTRPVMEMQKDAKFQECVSYVRERVAQIDAEAQKALESEGAGEGAAMPAPKKKAPPREAPPPIVPADDGDGPGGGA